MMSNKSNDPNKILPQILCPFCGTPWTEDMIRVFDISSHGGCDTCGYGASRSATLSIVCSNPKCDKTIYTKDYHSRD